MANENYRLNTVEKMLPRALEAIVLCKILDAKKNKVPKSYKGYISSFGAGIVLSGLLPTIAIFSEKKNDDNRSEEDRSLVLNAIWHIMNERAPLNENGEQVNEKHLLYLAVQSSSNHFKQQLLIEKITNAAIALKHALRTFEIEK